jgi:F0F1-type ATP synthase assembly protein I
LLQGRGGDNIKKYMAAVHSTGKQKFEGGLARPLGTGVSIAEVGLLFGALNCMFAVTYPLFMVIWHVISY